MAEQNPEKKIIIDEDWKSQVEAEKEAAKMMEEAEQTEPETEPSPAGDAELPPPTFAGLVQTFAAQVLLALGQIPDPIEKKPVVRLGVARHFVDTLGLLEEKTKGNLSPEEAQLLEGTLHELRMACVAMQNAPPPSPAGDEK
jgi:hypothetical protein